MVIIQKVIKELPYSKIAQKISRSKTSAFRIFNKKQVNTRIFDLLDLEIKILITFEFNEQETKIEVTDKSSFLEAINIIPVCNYEKFIFRKRKNPKLSDLVNLVNKINK